MTEDYSADTRVLLTMRWYVTPLTHWRMRRRLSLALKRAQARAGHS